MFFLLHENGFFISPLTTWSAELTQLSTNVQEFVTKLTSIHSGHVYQQSRLLLNYCLALVQEMDWRQIAPDVA